MSFGCYSIYGFETSKCEVNECVSRSLRFFVAQNTVVFLVIVAKLCYVEILIIVIHLSADKPVRAFHDILLNQVKIVSRAEKMDGRILILRY